MSKNFVVVLILTLVTLVAWVGYQLTVITTQPLPQPTQELIAPLDPELNQGVFEDLKKSVQ
jgi:hypothetical protein